MTIDHAEDPAAASKGSLFEGAERVKKKQKQQPKAPSERELSPPQAVTEGVTTWKFPAAFC